MINRNFAVDDNDLDVDTLTNYQEFQLGSYANNTDSDRDYMDDAYEVNNSLLVRILSNLLSHYFSSFL